MEPYALFALAAVYALVVWHLVPARVTPQGFFAAASRSGEPPQFWPLVASATISWVFAKSLMNVANLSQAFGIAGAMGYGTYYLSFVVAGVALYLLRARGGYRSLSQFVTAKYGAAAAKLFLLAVAIRLFNEIWSNTKVVGLFFGAEGSPTYWLAIAAFSAFTTAYAWRSGLRGSLLTDGVQMVLMGVLLALVLGAIAPALHGQGWPQVAAADSAAGWTFALLAFVQIWSYPFHDPVLTDRAFITPPGRMVRAFGAAGAIGGAIIVVFGLMGIAARSYGLDGSAAVAVARLLGLPLFLLVTGIMVTSAGSTLDSALTSMGRLGALDWHRAPDPMRRARRIAIAMAVVGNLPLLIPILVVYALDRDPRNSLNMGVMLFGGRASAAQIGMTLYLGDRIGPAIIAATTLSGSMVVGLAPIVLLGFLPGGPASFHLAFWPGLLAGILLTAAPELFPAGLALGSGQYALDAGVNLAALGVCTLGRLAGALWAVRASNQPPA